MDRGTRILLMGTLTIMVYLSTLYVLFRNPVVATFSGSSGETITSTFTVKKKYWDINIAFFKEWSMFWSLRIEIYKEGETKPIFKTTVILYTTPDGNKRAELSSHPSLPPGRYYLKIHSENVQWTIQIIEWD